MLDDERNRLWQKVDRQEVAIERIHGRLDDFENRFERAERQRSEDMAEIRTSITHLDRGINEARDAQKRAEGAKEANRRWIGCVLAIVSILVAAGYLSREAAAAPPKAPILDGVLPPTTNRQRP